MKPASRLIIAAGLVVCLARPGFPGSPATIRGGILDPDGNAAAGCSVIFREIRTEAPFPSSPSDVDGRFELQVPRDGRYRASAIELPGGRSVDVRDAVPVAFEVADEAHMDLRLVASGPAPAASGAGRKWYATTAVVIGIAAGIAALYVIVRDDTELPGSPSDPAP